MVGLCCEPLRLPRCWVYLPHAQSRHLLFSAIVSHRTSPCLLHKVARWLAVCHCTMPRPTVLRILVSSPKLDPLVALSGSYLCLRKELTHSRICCTSGLPVRSTLSSQLCRISVTLVTNGFETPITRPGNETHRCCIICLAKVAIDAGCTGDIYNTSIPLLEHVGPCCLGDGVCPSKMHTHHREPHVIRHIRECLWTVSLPFLCRETSTHLVSQYSGIVHNNIDPAVLLNDTMHNSWAILNGHL